MQYAPSVLLSALFAGGWVGLNRQWMVDDSELARCVRWAAAKTEWREASEAPVGWFHATSAEMADALGWGRTKAHAWMHDSDLFEARADGRRGTLMRLRIDVRDAIPARLRIPQRRRRCEQNREQTTTTQVAENTCIFRHAQHVREQLREQSAASPLHPPYKETEELPEEHPPTTHAPACEGGESRAPWQGEWACYLRAQPVLNKDGLAVLAFSRPPASATLRWLAQAGLRYDRSRSEWKGILGAVSHQSAVTAACRMDVEREALAASTARILLEPAGGGVWVVRCKVESDVRAYLVSLGGVEMCEYSRDAFGTHAGQWILPPDAASLLTGEATALVIEQVNVEPPPVLVVMEVPPVLTTLPEACSAPTEESVVERIVHRDAVSPARARLLALWQAWVTACLAAGLLRHPPTQEPWSHSENEARTELHMQIASQRGVPLSFSVIAAIERETAHLLA